MDMSRTNIGALAKKRNREQEEEASQAAVTFERNNYLSYYDNRQLVKRTGKSKRGRGSL